MKIELPPLLAAQSASGSRRLRDALDIWWSGVAAVQPDYLFPRNVRIDKHEIVIGDSTFSLRATRRIVVVGAGKASAAMASAFYRSCSQQFDPKIEVVGWINAPEGSFNVGSAGPIHLHAARPAGMNEPTLAAVRGTERIIQLVRGCSSADLCIVLISGGGSALLAAPIQGVTLADKQQVARVVSAAGGNIQQLNCVRRALSRVKGGGLAAECRARQLISLIISDVPGDPLESIASGPTVRAASVKPAEALGALEELGLLTHKALQNVVQSLRHQLSRKSDRLRASADLAPVQNIILANNATAVDAAGVRAVELGYRYVMQAARTLEGDVSDLSVKVADTLELLGNEPQLDCWISGGEPTVRLPTDGSCGRGGRNQQLMLLSMLELVRRGWPYDSRRFPQSLFCMSAGTDGEDGPTPAAGAWFDAAVWQRMNDMAIDGGDFARRADAYHFFAELNSLVHSGPTQTNVCDLRIALKSVG